MKIFSYLSLATALCSFRSHALRERLEHRLPV
jgi:hypothetical protein